MLSDADQNVGDLHVQYYKIAWPLWHVCDELGSLACQNDLRTDKTFRSTQQNHVRTQRWRSIASGEAPWLYRVTLIYETNDTRD